MSVFLGALTLISGTNYKVGRQYFNPPSDYQATDGIGIIVDSLPNPQPPTGMIVANTYVDTVTNTVTYDYAPIPQTNSQAVQTYDPTNLASVQQYQISQINTTAGDKVNGGFFSYAEAETDTSGNPKALLYKSDDNHREQLGLLNNLAQYHKQGQLLDTPCSWKDASQENGPCHTISDDAIMQLYIEMGKHILWCKQLSDTLVTQIMAATMIDAVNAVTFPDEPAPTTMTAS